MTDEEEVSAFLNCHPMQTLAATWVYLRSEVLFTMRDAGSYDWTAHYELMQEWMSIKDHKKVINLLKTMQSIMEQMYAELDTYGADDTERLVWDVLTEQAKKAVRQEVECP